MQDSRFSAPISQNREDTIILQKLLSVACAPLEYNQRPFGVIYIDNRKKEAVFSEDTGSLLKTLADLMSEALMKSLRNTIRKQRETAHTQQHIKDLREEVDRLKGYGAIIGNSPAMKKVYELIEKDKDLNHNVLITGESGTGKELVARALHRENKRRDKPFVKIDCSVFSDTMFESELFGHEKGAFTGADKLKIGFIEEASEGTIFFDEIGNLSLKIQQKLLQFLGNRVYHRVGSTREKISEARFVFATNKKLSELIEEGKFLDDLYYRIAEGVERMLPPLRERGNDIILIAEAILEKGKNEIGKEVAGFTSEAKECLLAYDFPGNVRELNQVVLRALINTESDKIGVEDLPPRLLKGGAVKAGNKDKMFLRIPEKPQKNIYSMYLPEEYRDQVFIWGINLENGESGQPPRQDEQRGYHDKLIISIKGSSGLPLSIASKVVTCAFERNFIIDKLIEFNGKIADAHTRSQVDKKTFIDKMKKVHHLKREWYVE